MKAAKPSPVQLFIYGTLLTGTRSPRLNRAMARLGARTRPAMIRARLYGLGAYPGAVPSPTAGDRVYGRLVSLPNAALLRQLDRYEDYLPTRPADSEFVRIATEAISLSDRRPIRCWVYFYNGDVAGRPRRQARVRL